jgi:hypothetical protein
MFIPVRRVVYGNRNDMIKWAKGQRKPKPKTGKDRRTSKTNYEINSEQQHPCPFVRILPASYLRRYAAFLIKKRCLIYQ